MPKLHLVSHDVAAQGHAMGLAGLGRISADHTMQLTGVDLNMGPALLLGAINLCPQFISKIVRSWHALAPAFRQAYRNETAAASPASKVSVFKLTHYRERFKLV
jgi:hypothetical protein